MIVFPSRRLVLATAMAVASQSLEALLTKDEYGGIREIDPDLGPHGFPCDYRDSWDLVIVTRNPFDRIVSLWSKCVVQCGVTGEEAPDFAEYVLDAASGRRDIWTISRWLDWRVPRFVLRFESLEHDLEELFGVEPGALPMVNGSARVRDGWESRYFVAKDVRRCANVWASEDCRRFSYPELSVE